MKRLGLLFLFLMVDVALAQSECDAGMFSHPESGRCVTKKEFEKEVVKRTQDQVNEATAQHQTKNTADKRGVKKVIFEDLIPTAGALAIGIPSSKLIFACPQVGSAYLLSTAATFAIIAEIDSVTKYKDYKKIAEEKMQELVKKYKKLDSPTIDQKEIFAANVQKEAFKILIEAEYQIAKTAKSKNKWHLRAATAYGVASAAAIAEASIPILNTASICPQANASSKIAMAATDLSKMLSPTAAIALGVVIPPLVQPVGSGLSTPVGRAIIAGSAAIYSERLSKSAEKQEKRALDRVKAIQQIMEEGFATNIAGLADCQEEDRTDPNKPNCYCFTEDWQKNPARNESQVCNQYWGKDYKPNVSDYEEFLAANGNTNSCITKDYQDDAKCNCLTSNSCLSLPTNFNIKSFPGISAAASSTITASNKYFKGQMSEGELAKITEGNAAFNKDNLLKSLAKNPQTREIAKDLSNKIDKGQLSLQNQVAKSTEASAAKNGGGGLNSPLANNIKDQLKSLGLNEQKINEKINKVSVTNNSSTISTPTTPSFDVDLDFSSLKPGAGIQIKEDEESNLTASQKFGSKESPVAKDDGQTIFQVITDRYQKTGMRKLFADRKRIKTE